MTTEAKKASSRAWKQRNREKVRAARKAYYEQHRDQEIETAQNWNTQHRERYLENQSIRHARCRVQETAYNRNRIRTNVCAYLSVTLGRRLNRAARDYGFTKCGSAKELLGCTIPEFIAHLESQFEDGMSWENRGKWHMDHIRPCASFDFSDLAQQRACFHYTNIQPLWATDNRKKGNRNGVAA